jgi:hypothetical protein
MAIVVDEQDVGDVHPIDQFDGMSGDGSGIAPTEVGVAKFAARSAIAASRTSLPSSASCTTGPLCLIAASSQ